MSQAELCARGLVHDRRFMLLRVHCDDPSSPQSIHLENMHVSHFPEMALFVARLGQDAALVEVNYHHLNCWSPSTRTTFPLEPDVTNLKMVPVNMHQSPTSAYEMPEIYSS